MGIDGRTSGDPGGRGCDTDKGAGTGWDGIVPTETAATVMAAMATVTASTGKALTGTALVGTAIVGTGAASTEMAAKGARRAAKRTAMTGDQGQR